MLRIENKINPTQVWVSDYKVLENGLIAHRYNLCGTSIICYEVYERSTNPFGDFSEIASNRELFPDCWLGAITSRRLTPELDALPAYSEERSKAVRAYFSELTAQAETCVKQAFPLDFKN